MLSRLDRGSRILLLLLVISLLVYAAIPAMPGEAAPLMAGGMQVKLLNPGQSTYCNVQLESGAYAYAHVRVDSYMQHITVRTSGAGSSYSKGKTFNLDQLYPSVTLASGITLDKMMHRDPIKTQSGRTILWSRLHTHVRVQFLALGACT